MKWSKTEKEIARQLLNKAEKLRIEQIKQEVASKIVLAETAYDIWNIQDYLRKIDKEWHFFSEKSWNDMWLNFIYLYNQGYLTDEDISLLSEEKRQTITFKLETINDDE